ncbi:hypothetical protein LSM04_006993 [Trypanosoma melophagium]|uniref:uncharacterized protein n=1 Tax=Trypanosoma melophagium TaxID=715481 RepID=UPI00351A61CD|nr:hypothetical protein LSM04_006993 [Trypanosoma melophagium]
MLHASYIVDVMPVSSCNEELEEADRLIRPSNLNSYSLLGPEYYCRAATNQERKFQEFQEKQEEKQESTLSREVILVAELQEAKNIIHTLIWDRDTIIARYQEV